MNQYKRLINNTFIFAVGTFSSKLLVFFMMRFYTWILSPDELGIAELITKSTNILYPIVSVSIGQAVIRFALEKSQDKRQVFSIGLTTIFCGFLIAIPFFPAFSFIEYTTSVGETASLSTYTFLIYLYVLTACLQNVCSQFIRSTGWVRLYAIDGIFRTVLTIGLNVLYLYFFQWSIFGYVFSIICSDAISTICLFLIARLWKYFSFRNVRLRLWRSMLRYSLPLVPAAILVYIIGFSDQYFLANMRNTAESGMYALAYRIPTLISLVASIFIDAWQLSSFNDNSRKEQITFFSRVGNAYSALVLIVASGGIMCSKLAIDLLSSNSAYYTAWTFIPLLSFGAAFSCLSSFQNTVYLVEKKTFQSLMSTAVAAACNLLLNYLLIPTLGGNGAALATLLSYLLLFLYRLIDTRRYLPVHWKGWRMLLTCCLLCFQIFLMLVEPTFWPFWQLLAFVVITAVNSAELMVAVKKMLHRA